jgi:hypothetical protein
MKMYAIDRYRYDKYGGDMYGMDYLVTIAESREEAIKAFRDNGYDIPPGGILEEFERGMVLNAMHIE